MLSRGWSLTSQMATVLEKVIKLPPDSQGTKIPEAPKALTANPHPWASPVPSEIRCALSCSEGLPSRQRDHTHPQRASETSELPSIPWTKGEYDGTLKAPFLKS